MKKSDLPLRRIMNKYSRIEEWALYYIGIKDRFIEKPSFKSFIQSFASSVAWYFVSGTKIFERGQDIEASVLAETGDKDAAWEAAEPYYDTARYKGNADAWYRKAIDSTEKFDLEIAYADYILKAAKLGHKQAIREYVYRYDDFKVKTISRNAYRRQKRQEKMYYRCCEILVTEGDYYALRKLAWCFILGRGVKKKRDKAIALLRNALVHFELDNDEKSGIQELIQLFSEDTWC
jgi:hypothetical protein